MASLALLLLLSCGQQQQSKNPDLPEQPDKLLNSILIQGDTKVTHVGKTSAVLGATRVKPIDGLRSIAVGDDIDGVNIGAIRCVFFNKDASYANEQFMWRGRWGCQAGRSQKEIENAVKSDGTKMYDYIYIAPVNSDG